MTDFERWLALLAWTANSPELSFDPEQLDQESKDWLSKAFRSDVKSSFQNFQKSLDSLSHDARRRLREVSKMALSALVVDFSRTTNRALDIKLIEDGDYVRPALDGGSWFISSHQIHALGQMAALVEIADMVQDLLMEREHLFWPECAEHQLLMRPEITENYATWVCGSPLRHAVSPIGSLSKQMVRAR